MSDNTSEVGGALLSSLDASARTRLAIMDRVRSKNVRTERSGVVEQAVQSLVDRMAAPPDMQEGRALVLVGESGAGKTWALDRIFRKNPAFPGYGKANSGCPLVSIDVPAPCTLKQLGRQTLRVFGYPLVAERREHVVWEMVSERLDLLDIRILHFDEAHNVIRSASTDEAARIGKTLKSLLNARSHPVSLILSGTPDLAQFLGQVPEMRRRCMFVHLDGLTPKDVAELTDIVAGLAHLADLAFVSTYEEDLALRLMHAVLRQLGTAIEITHNAIEVALAERSKLLCMENFATAYARRAGAAASANPFVAPDWAEIDCSKLLADGSAARPCGVAPPAPAQTRRRGKLKAPPQEWAK